MPLLPNLGDIPEAQFNRIVAAFPGATMADKAAAYRRWLTNRLIERVEQAEFRRIDRATMARRDAIREEWATTLPPSQEEPELPT